MPRFKVSQEEKERRISSAFSKVASYLALHGTRPTPSVSYEWRLLNWQLESIGSSLAKVSNAVGAPPTKRSWTLEGITSEVQAFIRTEGRHPNATRDKAFRRHDKWLRRRGTSLSWLCLSLGYESDVGGYRKRKAA